MSSPLRPKFTFGSQKLVLAEGLPAKITDTQKQWIMKLMTYFLLEKLTLHQLKLLSLLFVLCQDIRRVCIKSTLFIKTNLEISMWICNQLLKSAAAHSLIIHCWGASFQKINLVIASANGRGVCVCVCILFQKKHAQAAQNKTASSPSCLQDMHIPQNKTWTLFKQKSV